MNRYVLIDGNSLGHFANSGKVLKIGELKVQAIYNFLRTLRSIYAVHQLWNVVVIWDGLSWRYQVEKNYKSNRNLLETLSQIKKAAADDSYKQQRPYIQKALGFLGVPQLTATNMEADDLGAILADRYSGQGAQVKLMTGDQDWLQLVKPNVMWHDFVRDRKVTASNFEEFTGVKTPAQFVEVKALSGDSGDGLPGVGGLGKKGAIDFINQYGSFADFLDYVTLDKSCDFNKLPKKIKALVEDESKAIRFKHNIAMMDLRTTAGPAIQGLHLDKGSPSMERMERFCETLLFKSILQEFEDWIRVFPAFDHLNMEYN